MSETTFSRLELDDRGIAWLTLERPEVHNAFDDSLIAELNAHLERLRDAAHHGEIRAVVLGSTGTATAPGRTRILPRCPEACISRKASATRPPSKAR